MTLSVSVMLIDTNLFGGRWYGINKYLCLYKCLVLRLLNMEKYE